MTRAAAPEQAPPRPVSYEPRPFRAPWWLRGPHAQTIGGKFLRPDPRLPLDRERVETPDGDFVDLDLGPEPDAASPLVLVLHGLEGSSRRGYVQSTFRAVLAAGMRPVGLNFRGCSGELNRAPRFYHSGETGDLRFVLDELARRFPARALAAVGFSLGGNVLLKYLGEEGEAAARRVRAAVAISVPYDLSVGADRIGTGAMGRVYTHYFLRNLRRKAGAKRAQLHGLCDVDRVLATRSIRDFDDAATAPIHGFADAEDYYRRSSSSGFLDGIRVPTLLLHAGDDPFLPSPHLPVEHARRNPYLVAGFTRAGGHVGFIGGQPWRPRFWAEEETAAFLATSLAQPAVPAAASSP